MSEEFALGFILGVLTLGLGVQIGVVVANYWRRHATRRADTPEAG